MRRNHRLILVLLLSSVLYILIFYDAGTSTLQNTAPYSVTRLTEHLSVFVPTNSKTRSRINIHAANAISTTHRYIIDRVRPYDKDHSKGRISPKVQRRPKKMLGAHVKVQTHPAVKVRSNDGSGQELQNKKINGPSSKTFKLYSRHDVHPAKLMTRIKSRRKVQDSTSALSPWPVRVSTTTKVLSTKLEHSTSKPHETSESLSMSAKLRNDNGNVRSTSASGARVIIVAHGRSGSSFFGGIFNAHPDFFFLYEPLNQLNRIVNQDTDDILYSAEYVIKSILKCNFEDDSFLQLMSTEGYHRASSRPLVSPPFCKTTHERAINFVENKNWTLCDGNISAHALNKICRKHVNIATKILLERLEDADLSWILDISHSYPVSTSEIWSTARPPESPGDDDDRPVHVLYLVRDPRAMIYSRYRLGWVVPHVRHEHGLESGEADQMVKELCETIEHNLGAVLMHPQRIKLIRYEELVTNPVAMVKRLFNEFGISPSRDVLRWIYNKTHGPVKMHANSLSRNANASINAWRKKIPDKLLQIVETRCESVMRYLGYIPTNGSEESLHDLRKPLYLSKIMNLKESYQWLTG